MSLTRRTRFLLGGAIVAGVAAAVLFWPSRRRLTLTGIVTTDEVIVSSEIQGRLQELGVREGDRVVAGQRVGRIQPPEYTADLDYYVSAARQAEAGIGEAQADLALARAVTADQIEQARSNLSAARAQAAATVADRENARLEFEREQQLLAKAANSQRDFDLARTNWDGARARADSAAHQARAAEAALRVAEANGSQVLAREAALQGAVDQAAAAAAQREKARVRLGYTDIRAPIAGTVDVRAARPGEVVNPGQAIVTLIDPDDLWVRVDVEETYIERIRLGEQLTVRLPSGAERPGTVILRAVDADYATQRDVSRSKRDIRTFEVRLRCDNRDRALAVGMTAFVTIPLSGR